MVNFILFFCWIRWNIKDRWRLWLQSIVCVRACVRACMCVCACVDLFVHVSLHACVSRLCVCVSVRARVCLSSAGSFICLLRPPLDEWYVYVNTNAQPASSGQRSAPSRSLFALVSHSMLILPQKMSAFNQRPTPPIFPSVPNRA